LLTGKMEPRPTNRQVGSFSRLTKTMTIALGINLPVGVSTSININQQKNLYSKTKAMVTRYVTHQKFKNLF
jgi:hypothetical protein